MPLCPAVLAGVSPHARATIHRRPYPVADGVVAGDIPWLPGVAREALRRREASKGKRGDDFEFSLGIAVGLAVSVPFWLIGATIALRYLT